MLIEGLLAELKSIQLFFETSCDCLQEKDSGYAPQEGMYTVVNHVAHTAQTVDWFIDGMLSPNGFDMNFEKHIQAALTCTSLTEAKAWFAKSLSTAAKTISSKTEEELRAPLPAGPIMGGAPRLVVIGAISEHTAHHRGALAVYSRLLGYEPKMPYGEM